MTDRERGKPTPPEGVLSTKHQTLDARRQRVTLRRSPRPRRRGVGGMVTALVVVVGLGGAGWWVANRERGVHQPTDFTGGVGGWSTTTPVAGDRAVVLVFPEWDGGGFITEERQIASRDRPGEDLLALMRVLCEGPRISGAINPLPLGTHALAAFVNPDDQSVVVDFSQELVTGHPGGSAAETATLTAILRTVALNFPRTRNCVVLVEGEQVETLAGHLDLVRAFDPQRWL